MKHTPGPWKSKGLKIKSVNPLCKDSFFAESLVKGVDKECALANARLIAEAPIMLDHLKYIEYAISIYELASVSDDEILSINITGKVAKDIVKTITKIIVAS